MHNPLKILDQLIYDINHDSYYLTRDDQSAIEWRIQKLKNFINETYK